MVFRKILCLIVFSLLLNSAFSQNVDSLNFFHVLDKGTEAFSRKSYDSATAFYKDAYAIAVKKELTYYTYASKCLVWIGDCFFNTHRYDSAHHYYYAALLNTRKHKDHAEAGKLALRYLNELHDMIQNLDIPFNYPAVSSYTEQLVFFSIDRILYHKGDSALVQINGGLYDGIIPERNKESELFSITHGKEGGDYTGKVTVITVGNNKTIASVKLTNDGKIEIGWPVRLMANTSDRVMQSEFRQPYLYNFNWKNNDKKVDLFSRRFLYYYSDRVLPEEIGELLLGEVKDVVTKLGADTLKEGSQVRQVISEGIFKGQNIIAALNNSNLRHLRYFVDFMGEYYMSYTGQQFLFSETYAIWALNGSLLDKKNAKQFILAGNSSKEMMRRAKLLESQVLSGNMINSWVDDGLEMIDKNHWGLLLPQSKLLYHYGDATGRADCIAWSNFFDAVRRKASGNYHDCDSFLIASYENFKRANSFEGMAWIRSVRASVLDTSSIKLNIQSTHTLGYDLYPSPNKRYFATGSNDFTIKIWDVQLGKQVRTLEAGQKEVVAIAYNPGGRYMASLSKDSVIRIWNTYNYGLMSSFRPGSELKDLKFSPDGNFLLANSTDSSIFFFEPFTGKRVRTIRAPEGFARDFCFASKNRDLLYITCSDSAIYQYFLSSNKSTRLLKEQIDILNIRVSSNGKYGCYYTNDGNFVLIDFERALKIYKAGVMKYGRGGRTFYSDGSFSPDSRFFVYCNKDSITTILHLQDLEKITVFGGIKHQFAFSADGSYFISHSSGNPYVSDFSNFDWQKIVKGYYDTSLRFEDWKQYYYSVQYREFYNESAPVMDARFSKDGKSLNYLSWGTHKLDLGSGKSEILEFEHHWMPGHHQYPQNDDLIVYRKFKVDDTLFVKNTRIGEVVSTLVLPGNEKISSFCFFNNDTLCLLGGMEGGIGLFNLNSRKIVFNRRLINTGETNSISSLLLQPGTTRVIAFDNEMKPLVIDGLNGNIIDTIQVARPDHMALGAERLFVTNNKGELFYADSRNYSLKAVPALKTDGSFVEDMKISPSGKFVCILNEPFAYVIDVKSLKLIRKIDLEGKNLGCIGMSPNDSLLLVGSLNGNLALHNSFSGKLVSRIYFPFANDCILTDNEGHYLASKRALQTVVFNSGSRSYNYDQFDLQLNQPHKVLKALGIADNNTLMAYQKAYEKRLQRNGIAASTAGFGKTPSLIILEGSQTSPVTSQHSYNLSVQFYDFKYKLSQVRVFVNDVPIMDSAGSWSNLDTTTLELELNLPLTPGKNQIKLFCINQLGLSSEKQLLDVYCTATDLKQDIWFVGLGVNNYKDSANNLTYSAKDIRDMVTAFKNLYPDLVIDTLLNQAVTLEGIEALKQRLRKVKYTDRVIMAVTGHGLLSDSLDFYYATYDIDFMKPEKRGFRYEEMEGLLNNTAARQKLLLIDACHSGMVDKNSLMKDKKIFETGGATVTAKVSGAKGVRPVNEATINESSSFNLMQDLFADFSNNNGIVVISAAGGLEYALESGQWQNGVFTYSVLKALENNEADQKYNGGNEDYKVSVQELVRFVNRMVPELTKGRQQPTSRRENLDFDWIIKGN